MFKYAFILNSQTLTPESYSKVYENEEFYCRIAAINSMEMCYDLARKLAEDGVQLIDLCGDFDQEKAEAVRKATRDEVKVCYAKYTEEEILKLEALPSLNEYGIIIKAGGIGKTPVRAELKSSECNTYVAFVEDDSMAHAVANEMVKEGINFIELCSYFTKEKAEELVETIAHKVPVGYCG